MFQRNVARRIKISFAFFLMSTAVVFSHPTFAQSWGQLKEAAVDASSKKDFAGAEQYWKKSLEVSGASGPRYVQSVAGLAKLYADSNRPEQAHELYKKIESVASASNLSDAERSALTDYAQFLKQKGSADQAAELEKKFSLAEVKNDASSASTVSTAASSSSSSGADPKAAAQKDSSTWSAGFKSASEAFSQKNYSQAEKLLKEILPLAEKYSSSTMAVSTLSLLEDISSAQGKTADGESYAMRKVAAVRAAKGPMTKEFAQALMSHAGWLRKLNRKSEAIAEEGKAESILAHITPMQNVGGGSTSAAPTAIDASGARSGGIYSRAKAVQGFGGQLNNIINSPDN
jgi:tetratricopeptide (TPR) repeat protein